MHFPRRITERSDLWKVFLILASLAVGGLLYPHAVHGQSPSVFVTLLDTKIASGSTPTTAPTTKISPPGGGWSFSAAATVTGTYWNQIQQPNPGTTSTDATQELVCNSANNIALTSATGTSTSIHLTITINQGQAGYSEPNGSGAGGTTILGPDGLMGEATRIYSGANSMTCTVTGLQASAAYFLYFYGSTATAGQGSKFTLATANVPSGSPSYVDVPGGNSGNVFTTSGTGYALTTPAPPGVSNSTGGYPWGMLEAISDTNGTINFTTGKNSATGDDFVNGFQVMPYPLPTITGQPTFANGSTSMTAVTGAQVIMSVTASGTGTLSYQWEQGGSPITGDTNAMLILSDVQQGGAGNYSVLVSNPGGGVLSSTISLAITTGTVNPVPVIETEPASQSPLGGSSVTLAVTATGNAMTYQWYKNSASITGATNSSLYFSAIQPTDAGTYTAVVSNDGGSATSAPAVVTVLSPNLMSPVYTPANGATGLCPDTPLRITFANTPTLGNGTISVFDASTNTVVDSMVISGSTSTQVKTIGTLANFNYYPVIVTGSQATIFVRNGYLKYNKTYYVTADSGVFADAYGTFPGLSGTAAWRFSTKAFGPMTGTTFLNVAADNSGDFCTVQAALDFIPASNTVPTTVYVHDGTYTEMNYVYGKNHVTVCGQDRNQTVITYPNNNNFNPEGGGYHRMVFAADHCNSFTIENLSIVNSTPQGGSQAEALILNGNNTNADIAANVSLYSYQDTLQVNGQGYIADSYIQGTVDFNWGQGPMFFYKSEINANATGGYYSQIRNPITTTNHGAVFLDCTLDSGTNVTGMYLARIDPTAATGYPYSEVVFLNCVMGTDILPAGWLLNNTADQTAASAPYVHFWEYNSHDSNNNPINVSSRAGCSQQLTLSADSSIITNYSTPSYVLGNSWTPQLAPFITSQPVSVTATSGQSVSFSVTVAAIPDPTYQWMLYGAAIPGATGSTYTIPSVSSTNAGSYSVLVSNGGGTAVSTSASLSVIGGPPVITSEPVSCISLVGSNSSFAVVATGTGTLSYQWNKNGTPISSGTSSALLINDTQSTDGANYTVTVSNSGGSVTSNVATLTIGSAVAASPPTVPVIPAGSFNVITYGAVADGTTANTTAIQAAISAAEGAGGGTVEIPPASQAYESGPIVLYSNINLQVDSGAMLQALPFGTYPNSNTSPAHFITVNTNSTNVEISGGGTIDGNGSAWWNAFSAGVISSRPRILLANHTTTMLITGVTFTNAPDEHLTFAASNNITIYGVTIATPGYSPNTDGIDPAGSNYLIQNCSISDGDDNIAMKPGNAPSVNMVIANCSFGTGHGLSFGGQTNGGYNGVTVTNCTFNGTSTGLRMKADATEGGLVQNVTYSNITMTNVASPIVFYSYYNILSPNGVTPATVNTYNETPPNSLNSTTLPGWTNITINNLTATGATGYSIIWGLPLASCLISNVTLNNVQISGGDGLEIYDATNVQLTGSSNLGPYETGNAMAITGQPQNAVALYSGTAKFTVTAIGASGVNSTAPTYRWTFDGTPLADGTNADGSVVAGSATTALSLSNLGLAESGSYAAVVSGSLDGYNVSTSALVTNSIPVSGTSSAATLTVTDPFVTYMSGFGLDPNGNGAPGAEYDGNGISNIMEFALGGNPTVSTNAILPTNTMSTVNGVPVMVFQFNENTAAAATMSIHVEYSSDLQTWVTATAGQNGVTMTTTPVNGSTNHITVNIPLADAMFVRLHVVH